MSSYAGEERSQMNFNIYLDSEIGAALKRLAKRRKLTRNALIRKAVEELLEKETHSQEWSEAVLQWQGDPKFAPFESHRAKLAEPTQDPFG
jgi:predicted transcriptional regulator